MGEARQRRLAREIGRPWERDRPPTPEPLPWYADPMCPALPPRGPAVVVRDPPGASAGAAVALAARAEATRAAFVARDDGDRVLAPPREPARLVGLPVRRRHPMEGLLLLAALEMGSEARATETPRRRG